MPNWTDNSLTIKGHARTLAKVETLLKSKTDSEPLVLNNLLPCPEELLNDDWQNDKSIAAANTKKFGYEGWYDWRVAKWGTKWEASDVRFIKRAGELIYDFQSAWSPITEWVVAFSKRFPSLTITHEYHEEAGMYPSAIETYKGGELISREEIPNTNISEEEDEEVEG
jgi:hypothetical protein